MRITRPAITGRAHRTSGGYLARLCSQNTAARAASVRARLRSRFSADGDLNVLDAHGRARGGGGHGCRAPAGTVRDLPAGGQVEEREEHHDHKILEPLPAP